jgi:hypothetical protein
MSGKMFSTLFLNVRKKFFQPPPRSPTFLGKIMAKKILVKIILNWNTNMAAVTSCANALYEDKNGVAKQNPKQN